MAQQDAEVFDVAVIGAGPAGSATARWLAQRGMRVALLERTRFEAPRIGESLAPDVQEPLRRLGLWHQFMALAPLPSWGTSSLWGSHEPQSHSHMLNAHGCGWHVDRRAFDQMLAHGAADASASLREGTVLQATAWQDHHWSLRLRPAVTRSGKTPSQTLRARLLVDATGRSAQVARAMGARRLRFDRLVGVAVRWADVDPDEQGHLLVEAAREGWWYTAPLPADTQRNEVDAIVAMLMTDADLCATLRLTANAQWRDCVAATGATRARLARSRCLTSPKVYCAHSQRLLRSESTLQALPWLSVGDAALAVDPISGSGVLRALRTAHAAADTLCEMLERPHDWQMQLSAYEDARNQECTTYLLERAQYYAAEQRFETPFWLRRRVLPRAAD